MSKLKYYKNGQWNEVGGNISGDTLPIGSIVPFGGITAPAGWLLCIGQSLNISDYPELYNVIGLAFGGEEGGTTFNLPNLKGKVVVGKDSSQTEFEDIGITGGSKTDNLSNAYALVGRNTTTLSTMSYKAYAGSGATFDRTLVGGGGIDGNNYTAQDTTALGGSVNKLQPYMVTNYIIKVKQTAGLVGAVSDSYSTSHTDTYSCDYVNKAVLDDYSENETIVGSWTSGSAVNKTIYRKIVPRTTSISAGTEVTLGTAITNFGAPVNMYGFVYSSSLGYLPVNLINVAAQTYSCFAYVKSNGTIALRPAFAVDSAYIVLEYTKTTD